MSMKLLLKNADIVVSSENGYEVLRNAYLGIDGTLIDYIGLKRPAGIYGQEKDMKSRMLIPGLINCHGHSGMTLLRGLGSDRELHKWLQAMYPIEDRMRDTEIANGMSLALLEMIACGTTSFSDMYLLP
ncbi:MAG: amidohydrolase family protein, partial [Sphaerochaetaceae bacterium]